MFITFEGIDGSGKSTQLKHTAEYLKALGKEVICLREPGGTDLSEKIRELLLSSENKINSISELLLFEAARADLCSSVILPALREGKFVLSDRFFDSTTAYQGYGRKIDLNTINLLNTLSSMNIKPDLTFYLKIDLSVSHNRSKNRKPDRMESAGNEFFNRVINGFEEIANQNTARIIPIDSSHKPEDTFKLIQYFVDIAISQDSKYNQI